MSLGLMALAACSQNKIARKASEPSAAATNAQTSDISSSRPSSNLVKEYRIGVDDRLKVSVWRNPDLSVEVPVRPDGYISVPLAGDVLAGGSTPLEVAGVIEARLANYIRTPKVSVILTKLESHAFLSRVRVTGAVENPLSLPFRQGMTILDLVLEAGGLTDFALGEKARLYRKKTNGGTQAYAVDLESILRKGDLNTNFSLSPGDVITIPERRF